MGDNRDRESAALKDERKKQRHEPVGSKDAPAWATPPQRPRLDGSQVHVWMAELAALEAATEGLSGVLDEAERARAGRFRFQTDRDRFVLCRGLLRVLLGRYLGKSPERIRFVYSAYGKPSLDGKPAGPPLQFNLSHADGLALLAISERRRVGVDVERIRPERATEEIAQRFFSRDETATLSGLPRELRAEAFFRCWTRKEAFVKARGEGLSTPLDRFSVTLTTQEPPALLRCEGDAGEVDRWSLCDLAPPAGYAAALAVEGSGWELRGWRCTSGLVSSR